MKPKIRLVLSFSVILVSNSEASLTRKRPWVLCAWLYRKFDRIVCNVCQEEK